MKFYKKYTAKLHSFLVIGTTFVSVNPLRFRQNLLERKKLCKAFKNHTIKMKMFLVHY